MASVISMKALLESGVHFGHRTNKWNPLMKPFIFTERNGIHIIDLQQTVKSINDAYNLIRDTVANHGVVLFVGTKRQAQETIMEEATRCGMPYVIERWLGGTITNWTTIQQRLFELERLERMQTTGEINRLTKKERLMIEREIKRLETRLGGLRIMRTLPNLIFVVDVMREDTALLEANSKNIPVIAMVDTNCDPRGVDYVIPSNDDAIRAIKLLVSKVADAVLEGKAMRKEDDKEDDLQTRMSPSAPVYQRTSIQEDEIQDEDLLGASTLAKLAPVKVEETPGVEETEVKVEKVPVVKETEVKVVEAPVVEETEVKVVEAPVVEETVVEKTEDTKDAADEA